MVQQRLLLLLVLFVLLELWSPSGPVSGPSRIVRQLVIGSVFGGRMDDYVCGFGWGRQVIFVGAFDILGERTSATSGMGVCDRDLELTRSDTTATPVGFFGLLKFGGRAYG